MPLIAVVAGRSLPASGGTAGADPGHEAERGKRPESARGTGAGAAGATGHRPRPGVSPVTAGSGRRAPGGRGVRPTAAGNSPTRLPDTGPRPVPGPPQPAPYGT